MQGTHTVMYERPPVVQQVVTECATIATSREPYGQVRNIAYDLYSLADTREISRMRPKQCCVLVSCPCIVAQPRKLPVSLCQERASTRPARRHKTSRLSKVELRAKGRDRRKLVRFSAGFRSRSQWSVVWEPCDRSQVPRFA